MGIGFEGLVTRPGRGMGLVGFGPPTTPGRGVGFNGFPSGMTPGLVAGLLPGRMPMKSSPPGLPPGLVMGGSGVPGLVREGWPGFEGLVEPPMLGSPMPLLGGNWVEGR